MDGFTMILHQQYTKLELVFSVNKTNCCNSEIEKYLWHLHDHYQPISCSRNVKAICFSLSFCQQKLGFCIETGSLKTNYRGCR